MGKERLAGPCRRLLGAGISGQLARTKLVHEKTSSRTPEQRGQNADRGLDVDVQTQTIQGEC